jgi:DNA-binding GntR family transcriptional regulator
MKRTVADHRAIHEALVNRDGELAAARMTAHIDLSWSEKRSRSKAATD